MYTYTVSLPWIYKLSHLSDLHITFQRDTCHLSLSRYSLLLADLEKSKKTAQRIAGHKGRPWHFDKQLVSGIHVKHAPDVVTVTIIIVVIASVTWFEQNALWRWIRRTVAYDVMTDGLRLSIIDGVGSSVEDLAVNKVEARRDDVNDAVMEMETLTNVGQGIWVWRRPLLYCWLLRHWNKIHPNKSLVNNIKCDFFFLIKNSTFKAHIERPRWMNEAIEKEK